MSLPSSPENRLSRSQILILAGISLFSVLAYLLICHLYFRLGFPLDDAWIHQTYARNLALRGEWAFLPKQPSGGSTAPLWTVLLAIGHWLGLAPYAWTYALGAAILFGLAVLAEHAARRMITAYRPRFPWIGSFVALEWHLVWAAASGMETLLHAALVTAVLVWLSAGRRNYLGVGLLIGLTTWVRPDGITLLGPAALTALLVEASLARKLRAFVSLALGFGALFAFYLLFNLALAGTPWPSTFYAKQAEYAILQQIPLWKRILQQLSLPLIGAGRVLLPGLVLWVIIALRRRNWGILAGLVWLIGYLGLYAWRLPVTYQHGRYAIPAMPIFFLWGLLGLVEFASRNVPRWRWMVVFFWQATTALVLLLFWGRGALAYAQDVAVIESEMVATAKWVAANTPSEALVAAHDIGAMGYFSERELADLAGLVSPEVIPFIRDEVRLAAYLDEVGAEYLVTFPGWYPDLTRGKNPVFVTNAPYAPALGRENMAVYRWR